MHKLNTIVIEVTPLVLLVRPTLVLLLALSMLLLYCYSTTNIATTDSPISIATTARTTNTASATNNETKGHPVCHY